ncbi:MAG: hypothetical protein Q8Q37_01975 [bacterium]|nr:hypothetical protein [bacterium]
MNNLIKRITSHLPFVYSGTNKLLSAALLLNVLGFHINFAVPFDLSQNISSAFESGVIATSLYEKDALKIADRLVVTLTAYSSTPDQTDDSPFITASNTYVHDGTVAANFLPFNTRIMIPELFGDKIFVVEDRMHKRFSDRVDIWFAERSDAQRFGKQQAEILVLAS